MKDKNLPPDNDLQSLEELTKEANNIIESLEAEKDLQNSVNSYQELLKLNNMINSKDVSLILLALPAIKRNRRNQIIEELKKFKIKVKLKSRIFLIARIRNSC